MLQLPDSKLEFDEEQHLYKLGGICLPSVTQIMKPMNMMLYENVDRCKLYDAASRGTRAHEQISNMIVYGIEESDEDTVPYVEAFKSFSGLYNPTWVASEYRTYHKALFYAGTLDLVGYVQPDDGTGVDVIDMKTTVAWHGVPLKTQVAAYSEALRSHGVKVRRTYGLQLKKDGTFRFEELKNGYPLFLHCLGLYNAMAEEFVK